MVVSIILLNYRGLANTLDCLKSLRDLKKDKISTKIIVVDNHSQDKSAATLSKVDDIIFIKNSANLGFSAGNNVGIKYAIAQKSDYILILNNDTIVHPQLLEYLLKATKNGDIISPKIYFAPGFEFHKDKYKRGQLGKVLWYAGGKIDWQNILGTHVGVDQVDIGQFDRLTPTDFATGACMLVKNQVFQKIGLFDEKYFLYLEDMDFSVRAQKAGLKTIYAPKAILWHKNAASIGGSGSLLQNYYISRSRLLFATKFAKLRTKIAVSKQIFFLSFSDPIQRSALGDFMRGYFGQYRNS